MTPDARHILIILDGYGIAENANVSAIDRARKPYIDSLFARYPSATLEASGMAVGLPRGQMGNSEVGHMNLGAGRIVYQEITRIDKAIEDGDFFENPELIEAVEFARRNRSKLHIYGLFSDGGVHSSNEHLYALLQLARDKGLEKDQVCIHAFTDGRDTDPKSGIGYAREFQERAREIGVGRIVSVIGRYYAMDRDQRWERTEVAYRLLTDGDGEVFENPIAAFAASYEEGVTDEFIKPRRIEYKNEIEYGDRGTRIEDNDAVIFYNFRGDRARQITRVFTEDSFDAFDRGKELNLNYTIFSPYDDTFDLPVAFKKVNLNHTLGEVIAERGGTQLRAAETEKYPHVTYFFNGGREEPFENEDRILVASPKVATYDLKPDMSAPELADRVVEALSKEKYNFVCLNFANSDMVGHTGVFEAAVAAVEAVDACVHKVVDAALAHGYSVNLIADHGNSDRMQNPDGSPHTAHTTALVPHLVIKEGFNGPVRDGKLADIAPTILTLLGEEPPPEMEGDVLV